MNIPYAERRAILGRSLSQTDLDAVLISHPIHVTYLTGFTGEASHLVVQPHRVILVSDGRFTEQIAEECPDLELVVRPTDQTIWQESARVLDKLGVRRIGVEALHVTLAEAETLRQLLPSADWVPVRGLVETQRRIKDATEIAAIREAVSVAEHAFTAFRATARSGDREKDLVDTLEHCVRRAGGQRTAFPPIMAVGPRSALPHCPPSDLRLETAAFVLADWGAVVRGYHSDLTRVLWRRGAEPVESRLANLYTVVESAQRAALAVLRPGVACRDVDAAARRVIDAAGYGPFFNHGLGHGLGLEIHEGPTVRANSADVLEAGMVVTIEPGVYLPGFGGVRLEDDVWITPDGYERLTSLPLQPAALLIG